MARQVRVAVGTGSATFDEVIDGTLGISTSFNPRGRARMTGPPLKNAKLYSDLKDVFSQLQTIDNSIAKANDIIDELKQSTRSVLVEMSRPSV
jgi:hypothetical protein